MQDVMIEMSPLNQKKYTSRYTYDWVYNSLRNYVNLDCRNDVKTLIITDSFGRVVTPYLAMEFKELKCVYDLELEPITHEMIEEYNPDVVILLFNQEFALSEGSRDLMFEGF